MMESIISPNIISSNIIPSNIIPGTHRARIRKGFSLLMPILFILVTMATMSVHTVSSPTRKINVPAHFNDKFTYLTINRGKSARLTCEAYGSGPISVRWSRQDVRTGLTHTLPVADFASYDEESSQSVSSGYFSSGFRSRDPDHDPDFLHRVRETYEERRRRKQQQHHHGPHHRTHPTMPSDPETLEEDLPPRFYAFQKDFGPPDERTVFELHILSTVLMDSALYSCNISNEFGDDDKKIELKILDVPSPPENIQVDGIFARGISLKWTPSRSDGNSLITEYIIQCWKENVSPSTSSSSSTGPSGSSSSKAGQTPIMTSPYGLASSSVGILRSTHPARGVSILPMASYARMIEVEVSSSVTSHVLTDRLTPGASYSLRMMGQNANGRGASSHVVRFNTKELPPDAPPMDIGAESMGATMLVLKWKPPPKDHWNGRLKGYRVGYKVMAGPTPSLFPPTGIPSLSIPFSSFAPTATGNMFNDYSGSQEGEEFQGFEWKNVSFSSVPTEEQQLILTGLSKGTTYGMMVQAFNVAGEGPFSQQVIVSTTPNDPPESPGIWVTGVTETSIRLKWDQKKNPQDLTHYILYYKDERSPWMEIAFPVPQDKQYELLNLEKGNSYQLYMRAVSSRGTSDPSEVLTVKTEESFISNQVSSSLSVDPLIPAPRSLSLPSQSLSGSPSSSFSLSPQSLPSLLDSSSTTFFSYGSQVTQEPMPIYMRSFFVVTVSIAVVVVVVACAFALAYIKYEEKKAILVNQVTYGHYMCASPSRNFQYVTSNHSHGPPSLAGSSPIGSQGSPSGGEELTLRYGSSSSAGSGRPLLAPRPPIPSAMWIQSHGPIAEETDSSAPTPYSTLPMHRATGLKRMSVPGPDPCLGNDDGAHDLIDPSCLPPPPSSLLMGTLPSSSNPISRVRPFSGCTFGHAVMPESVIQPTPSSVNPQTSAPPASSSSPLSSSLRGPLFPPPSSTFFPPSAHLILPHGSNGGSSQSHRPKSLAIEANIHNQCSNNHIHNDEEGGRNRNSTGSCVVPSKQPMSGTGGNSNFRRHSMMMMMRMHEEEDQEEEETMNSSPWIQDQGDEGEGEDQEKDNFISRLQSTEDCNHRGSGSNERRVDDVSECAIGDNHHCEPQLGPCPDETVNQERR